MTTIPDWIKAPSTLGSWADRSNTVMTRLIEALRGVQKTATLLNGRQGNADPTETSADATYRYFGWEFDDDYLITRQRISDGVWWTARKAPASSFATDWSNRVSLQYVGNVISNTQGVELNAGDTSQASVRVVGGNIHMNMGTSAIANSPVHIDPFNDIVYEFTSKAGGKTDIHLADPPTALLQSNVVWYKALKVFGRPDKGTVGERHQLGWIAEDLHKVWPPGVVTDADGEPHTLNLVALLAGVTRLLQDIDHRVTRLEQETSSRRRRFW